MGTIIGLLFFISGISQTRKLYMTKDSRGISRLTYGMAVLAIYLTIYQAYVDGSWQILLSTAISSLVTTTNLILILRYHYAK